MTAILQSGVTKTFVRNVELAHLSTRSSFMNQNNFLETGFSDEDATVYALEADCAAQLAKFIHARYPANQKAAAKHLKLHQSEISELLSGNIGRRFSLSKLIRIARRAGIRFYIDMGDNANAASACTLAPTLAKSPANLGDAQLLVPLFEEAPIRGGAVAASGSNEIKTGH
jgi:predicted XRE-type DNA-binding protein